MVKRLFLALPLACIGALWFEYLALPWPVVLRTRDPQRTALMEYRMREAAARGDTLVIQHQWVPLDRISRNLRRAVIAAEDARFYQHRGIDWAALREELEYGGDTDFSWTDLNDLRALFAAIRYYREHRAEVRGRSTITQQLAKNLYFTPERSLLRKAEELIVARRLERFLSKDRILEIYLNVAEWGPGIFGAEAAARHYFGRSAADLTLEQAAALAATLPHPLTSNPKHRPGRMQWRQRLILDRLRPAGRKAAPPPIAPELPAPLAPESLPVPPEPPVVEPGPAIPVPEPVPDGLPPPDATPPDGPADSVLRPPVTSPPEPPDGFSGRP
ncbi:MAG: transglycosylase domain-containing protein [bacterium]|jgi:monofunctional biosynthetic peptidoglycan transglycosylase|nr:MAG: monofunctional biosynthetic peptidoglycan transglycosylase [bacterium]